MIDNSYKRRRLLIEVGLLTFFIALPFLLVQLLTFTPTVSFVWDGANAFGFVAFGLLLYLFVETGRPKAEPRFVGKFFLNNHRNIALLVLLFTTMHGVIFLIAEPVTLQYILPTAPLYMLAGVGAWFIFLFLTVSSFKAVRTRFFSKHTRYAIVHGGLSVVTVFFTWFHIIDTQFYFNTSVSRILSAVFTCVLLAYYFYARQQQYVSRKGSHVSAKSIKPRIRGSDVFARLLLVSSLLIAILLGAGFMLIRNASI